MLTKPHSRALALVGHLCAVDGDAVHDDADGLAERLDGVVLVPDLAAVELAALGRCAEGGNVLADDWRLRKRLRCRC